MENIVLWFGNIGIDHDCNRIVRKTRKIRVKQYDKLRRGILHEEDLPLGWEFTQLILKCMLEGDYRIDIEELSTPSLNRFYPNSLMYHITIINEKHGFRYTFGCTEDIVRILKQLAPKYSILNDSPYYIRRNY